MENALAIGGLIVGLLGLASIPLSIMFARRSRQTPDLRVARDFDEVVPQGDWLLRGGLVITFEEKRLERVSRTYFAIWNHRGDTIRGSEVLEKDPLRVEVPEGDEVLQARVVASSRPQLGVDVRPEGRTANITFDFMDARDGAVIEVLHYGDQGAELKGTIPGARLAQPRRAALSPAGRSELRRGNRRRVFTTFYVVWGLIAVAYGGLLLTAVPPPWSPPALIIDTTAYELDTIDGQREFAREVQSAGSAEISAVMWVAAGVMTLMGLVGTPLILVRRSRQRLIPKQIVIDDLDPDPVPDKDDGGKGKV